MTASPHSATIGAVDNDNSITTLLNRAKSGDELATEGLIELIYPVICQIASRHLHRIGHNVTLETRDLANEAYLKIAKHGIDQCESTRHFYNAVCIIVQNLLIDHGRKKLRNKRGSEFQHVSISEDWVQVPAPENFPDWLMFDQATKALADINPSASEMIQLRFLLGMSIQETAEAMNIGTATVTRQWQFARAWLRRFLETEQSAPT